MSCMVLNMRLALAVALLVSGCIFAGASHSAAGPDTWAISCKRKKANCYEEAAEVCPRGYDVLDQESRPGFYADRTVAVSTYSGDMLIRCQ